MENDQQLLARVLRGDRMAYRDLVQRYQGVVYGYCFSLVKSQSEARKLARETFVQGFVEAASRDEGQDWLEFMSRIARRLHRQGKRMKSSSIVSGEPDGGSSTQAGEGMSDELRIAVAEELHALDAEDRVAMTLRHGEGMTIDEAADVLGEAPKAVAARVSRGFKAVRDRLLTRSGEGGSLRGI